MTIPASTIAQKVQNYTARGKQSLELGKAKLAIEMFKQALLASPKALEARVGLRAAQILAFKQEAPSGLAFMVKKLLKTFTSMKVSSLIKNGRGIEAMAIAEELLELDPLDPKYIDLAVKAAESAGMPEAAAMTIEAAYASSPSSNLVLLEKVATYYMIAKNYAKARDTYKKILEADPTNQRILQLFKNTEAQFTISDGWEQTAGKVGGTRDLLKNKEEAERIDRGNKAEIIGDDASKVAAEYIKRLEAIPHDTVAARALARLYMKSKKHKEAIDVLEKVTKLVTDPELDKMLSTAKLAAFDSIIEERAKRGEDFAEVKAERDRFELDDLVARAERYPNDGHLRFELGSKLVGIGSYDDAIKHLQVSQKNLKDRLESLYLLAKCFKAKGQRDLAVMQLETARDSIQTMTELKKKVIYELALCAEDSCEDEKAYDYYKDIYSNDVTFLDVERRMMVVKKVIDAKKA